MASLSKTTCCGVKELHELSGDVTDLVSLSLSSQTYPHFLITDNKSNKRGEKVADLIRKNELGNLIETPYKKNPNSGNQVRAWLFTPSWTKLKSFVRKNSGYKVVRGVIKRGGYVTGKKDNGYTVTRQGVVCKVIELDKEGKSMRVQTLNHQTYWVNIDRFVRVNPTNPF